MSTISSVSSESYKNYQTTATKQETVKADKSTEAAKGKETTSTSSKTEKDGVVYEKNNRDYKTKNAALISKLKSDTEARMAQMQSLVQKMFSKQGITIGTADDMWKVLASGKFTADPDTIAQAKEDIGEDGYWGVKQTSERIFSFAKALSGGDAEQMEKMRKAFEKGFGQATKSWGKSLPSISHQTYDAVEKMFDDYAKDASKKTDTEE